MSLCGVGVLVMAASFAVVAATATEKATWETVDAEGICDGGVCANLMLLQSHMAMKEDMRNTNQVMVEKNSEKVMQDKDDVCSACGSGYKCYYEFGNSQICLTMADATAFCSGTVCLSGEAAVTTTGTTTTQTTITVTFTTQTIDVLIPDVLIPNPLWFSSEGGGVGVTDIDIDDAGLSLD